MNYDFFFYTFLLNLKYLCQIFGNFSLKFKKSYVGYKKKKYLFQMIINNFSLIYKNSYISKKLFNLLGLTLIYKTFISIMVHLYYFRYQEVSFFV